jgi:hypothetical protein
MDLFGEDPFRDQFFPPFNAIKWEGHDLSRSRGGNDDTGNVVGNLIPFQGKVNMAVSSKPPECSSIMESPGSLRRETLDKKFSKDFTFCKKNLKIGFI